MVAAAPTPTADELASLAAEAGAALPLGPIVVEPAPTDAVPAETAPPKPQHTRRRRLRGWGLKLVTTLVSFALFVGGIAFGMNVYNRVQPPPPLIGDPSTGGVATVLDVRYSPAYSATVNMGTNQLLLASGSVGFSNVLLQHSGLGTSVLTSPAAVIAGVLNLGPVQRTITANASPG